MSRFFIDRPIFAWVVSLGILLAGFLALRALHRRLRRRLRA